MLLTVVFFPRTGEHGQKARDVTHQVLEVMDGVASAAKYCLHFRFKVPMVC